MKRKHIYDRLIVLPWKLQVYDRLCMYYILAALDKFGPMRNGELKRALAMRFKEKVMNDNLKSMVKWGMIERTVSDENTQVFVYRLLPSGRDLLPVVRLSVEWSEKYGEEIYQRIHGNQKDNSSERQSLDGSRLDE